MIDGTQLLATKLFIPPARPDLVSRSRLVERLNAGIHRKLSLISAPAGFGKTTLVGEWVAAAGRPVAWLSLDEGDSDPARFLAYLIAALQQIDAAIGRSVQVMLQAPQPPPPEPLLTALVNDIAGVTEPFILVLDDYHLVTALPVHQQLGFLLEHQPPQMHLVVATREDPPLPISRLRARGQMTEIRQADLQFTMEEAIAFLQRMALELSSDDVASLLQRTEGWAAGLQMVALSLRGTGDTQTLIQSFTGSHRYILDYLVEEVFQQQDADVQNFLLETSILDRLTSGLCDTVTGRSDSHEMLRRLEQANLFVVSLDESRQWYRYHRLFADLLYHRLETECRAEVPDLHRQASQWYVDNGFAEYGVRHALAGTDWERAAQLIIELSGPLLKRGEAATLLVWLQTLPEEMVLADPQLCLEVSWPLILTDQIEAAESYLTRAEQAAEEQGNTGMLGAIAAAHVHIARVRGDNQRAAELSERALALLPETDHASRSVVALNLGMSNWFRGRLAEAEEVLTEAERAGRGSGNDYVRFAAMAFLGRVQTVQGRPLQAAELCQRIVEEGGQSPIVAVGHYDLGRLAYECNDLETADQHIEQGIDLSRCGQVTEFVAGGLGTLAAVKQALGETAAALGALREAEALLDQADISPATRLCILIAHILIALAQDDVDTAASAAQQAPKLEESGSFPDYLSLMLAQARLFLAQGEQTAAAQHLATLHGMASQSGYQSVAIKARALQSLTCVDPEEALTALSEALALAEPLGYVRTFVDAGRPMRALLHQAAVKGIMDQYVAKLLAIFTDTKYSRYRISDFLSRQSGLKSETVQPETLVEPLSDRELDVLRLLAEHRTNQEIAHSLCVSVNTIKTHLKNVYGKLGVSNRREAIAKAKALNLVA
jgi:LuxR family maltose regulon positive regulatory protein